MINVIEIVWAILRKNDKFLLAQKAWTDIYGGTWVFPGGKIDSTDKTPEMAVYRELKEKVGLIGKRFRKLGHIQFDKYHIRFFICDRWIGEPKPSCKDIIRIGWLSLAKVYSIDLKLSPFLSDSLMSIAYLIQNYDHFPDQCMEIWKEIDECD